MAVCQACRTGRPGGSGGPGPGAVLVLRVWSEESGLRARLLSGDRAAVAQGVDAICEQVRRWLATV